MTSSSEALRKWEPTARLPEQQLGTVNILSDHRRLVATAYYDDTAPTQAVQMDFGVVEAFKVYEEFSDNAVLASAPMMSPRGLGRVTWPFLEVLGSSWIARVKARNGALDGYRWRHFVVTTLDVTLHVMTRGDVKAERVEA